MDSAPHKAKNARVFAREVNDFYVEEPDASRALFAVERFGSVILDPACGTGNIIRAAEDAGYQAFGSDLVDRAQGRWPRADFIASSPLRSRHFDSVVCNPPFNAAEAFVERGLEIASLKVAVLNRLAWLEGGKRADWFARMPLARVWVFSWRLNMPPGDYDGPRKGGTTAFAFFVFEHGWEGPPQLRWLRRPAHRARS